jgi:hypothetical protein
VARFTPLVLHISLLLGCRTTRHGEQVLLRLMRKAILVVLALAGIPAGTGAASTSHDGWSKIDGMLL